MKRFRRSLFTATVWCLAVGAQAGVVVASHDTATLNSASPGLAAFAGNLVRFLDGDGEAGGRVLVFNRLESLGNNANVADTLFARAVAPLGYTVVEAGTATPFTLDALRAFDAVLLAGRLRDPLGVDLKNDTVLQQYVAGGGGVYVAAGAGGFAPNAQAAYWNSFLEAYGLAYEPDLNNRVGLVGGGSGPLFEGVDTLSAGNGQDLRLLGTDAEARLVQLAPSSAVRGLLAVHVDPPPVGALPVPGSLALAVLGLALLRRRPAGGAR
jgi:hypothetical protein